MSLTPKQEKFCQLIIQGKNQTDAYRGAYDAKNMAPATINNKAYVTINRDDIKARIEELRIPIVKKVKLTLEKHLEDLQALRNMATKKEQFSAAITAEVARGKASGLYIEKVQDVTPGAVPRRTLADFYRKAAPAPAAPAPAPAKPGKKKNV
jgi:phage terminase small subunit